MSIHAYVESIKAIENNLEMWTIWEAKHIDKLSQCDDNGQREMWERSLSIAVDIKGKKLIELQRMKEEEEHAVLSFMFPALH